MRKKGLSREFIISLIIILIIFVIVLAVVSNYFKDTFNTEFTSAEDVISTGETQEIDCLNDDDCPKGQVCENGICIGNVENQGVMYVTEG